MKPVFIYSRLVKTIKEEKTKIIIMLNGPTIEERKYLVELKKLK